MQVRTDAAVLSDPRSVRLLSAVLAGKVVREPGEGTATNTVYTFNGEDCGRQLHWLVEEGLVLINETQEPVLSARAQQIVLVWRSAA